MDLTPTKKLVATGAAALGIVLGAAGITAAATNTTSTVPAQSGSQSTVDKPEGNDTPDANDANDKADANEAHDKADGTDNEQADANEANDPADANDQPEANDQPDTGETTTAPTGVTSTQG
jgi:hypothetical protein